MTPILKPTLAQSVDSLKDRDEYKVILQYLRDERERFFGDLRQCQDNQDVMKIVGSVSTIDEIITVLS